VNTTAKTPRQARRSAAFADNFTIAANYSYLSACKWYVSANKFNEFKVRTTMHLHHIGITLRAPHTSTKMNDVGAITLTKWIGAQGIAQWAHMLSDGMTKLAELCGAQLAFKNTFMNAFTESFKGFGNTVAAVRVGDVVANDVFHVFDYLQKKLVRIEQLHNPALRLCAAPTTPDDCHLFLTPSTKRKQRALIGRCID